MQIYRKSVMLVHMAIDAIILTVVFFSILFINEYPERFNVPFRDMTSYVALCLAWFWWARISGLYDEFRSRNFSFELIALAKVVAMQVLTGITLFYLGGEIKLPRSFIFIYSSSVFVLVGVSKFCSRIVLERFRKHGRNLRSMLIIGAGEMGMKFSHSISTNPHFGYKLVGFIDDEKKSWLNGLYLGKVNDLDNVLKTTHIDVVIVALPNTALDRIASVVDVCEQYTTRVKILPNYFQLTSSKYNVTMFGEFPMFSLREDRLNEIHWRLLKRGVDCVLTLAAFVLLFSWLWPLIAIAIKLSSKGPVFYKQERWGRNNRPFIAYKFRSMKCSDSGTEAGCAFKQATKNDPRVTRVGKFLRKTNLDELPQFINVLRGEMALVGPRPHPTPLNDISRDQVRQYMLRHLVKPGITGWAQVNGHRGETKDLAQMRKRIEHDVWYIENWSPWLDLQIIFLTIWNMVKGDPNAY